MTPKHETIEQHIASLKRRIRDLKDENARLRDKIVELERKVKE